jgi:hypothetical protein
LPHTTTFENTDNFQSRNNSMPPKRAYRSKHQKVHERKVSLDTEIEALKASIAAGEQRQRLYNDEERQGPSNEAQRSRSPSVPRTSPEKFEGSKLHREIMATTEGLGDQLLSILGGQDAGAPEPAPQELPLGNNDDPPSAAGKPSVRDASASPAPCERAASKTHSEIRALTKGEKAARTKRLNKAKAAQDAIDNAANEAARAQKASGKATGKKRLRSDGAELTDLEDATLPKRMRGANAAGGTPAGPSKKMTASKVEGATKKTAPKKDAVPKKMTKKRQKAAAEKTAAEQTVAEDDAVSNAGAATPERDHDDDAEDEAPVAKKKAKKSKKRVAEEKASLSGPFGGKVIVLRGHDAEALIARSLQDPTPEMLRHRKMIWDMCERCARYLCRGTSTHPSRLLFL